MINEPNNSFVEDNISTYRSSGTASTPVRIHNNFIMGGYPINPATDGYSGGGIMAGDGDHDDGKVPPPAYIYVYDNQVINTTNYGIAIAGGHNHKVLRNRVVNAGKLSDGTVVKASNVGVYV